MIRFVKWEGQQKAEQQVEHVVGIGTTVALESSYDSMADRTSYWGVYQDADGNWERQYDDAHEGSSIDAPPALLAQWQAYCQGWHEESLRRSEALWRQRQMDRFHDEALEPAAGRRVRVVRGRKVPRGTTGMCFWRGSTEWGIRIGLKTESGATYFTAASNVQVLP